MDGCHGVGHGALLDTVRIVGSSVRGLVGC